MGWEGKRKVLEGEGEDVGRRRVSKVMTTKRKVGAAEVAGSGVCVGQEESTCEAAAAASHKAQAPGGGRSGGGGGARAPLFGVIAFLGE